MRAIYSSDADIQRVGQGLMDRSLPKAEWTHAAHFAAALWLMRSGYDALAVMPGLIRAYNEAQGGVNDDANGYHETITQASLRAAAGILALNGPEVPLFAIVNALMATNLGNPNWLLEYWTRDRLMSVDARRAWLEPDLKALPF